MQVHKQEARNIVSMDMDFVNLNILSQYVVVVHDVATVLQSLDLSLLSLPLSGRQPTSWGCAWRPSPAQEFWL